MAIWILTSGGSRISPRKGRQLRGGHQHTNLPNFARNCMKLKEFGPWGGHVSFAPLRSATVNGLSLTSNVKLAQSGWHKSVHTRGSRVLWSRFNHCWRYLLYWNYFLFPIKQYKNDNITSYVSRLRACGPEFPEYLRYGQKGTGRSTGGGGYGSRSVTVMNPISLLGGHALTSPEGGGPCPLGTLYY